MTPEDDPQANYWLSYQSSQRQPDRLPRMGEDNTVVTVVLDFGAHKQFDGIRLLIICNGSARELCARSMLTVDGFTESRTHRNHMFTQKRILRDSSSNIHHGRRFCTMFFELYQSGSTFSLRPWRHAPIQNASERLHILHDIKYPFHTLYVTFSVWGNLSSRFMWKSIHNVRVLPSPCQGTEKSLPSFVSELSKDILLEIIRYALGKRDHGWRTELIQYGTVCRAWTFVLDLFFESAQSRHCKDRPSAQSVAHALEQRPYRKGLLNAFLPSAYSDHYDNGRYIAFSDACIRILRLVPNLTYVALPILTTSVWEELDEVLQGLHGVRKCTLQAQMIHRPSALTRHYSIHDIQIIVSKWKHLRTLRLEGWLPQDPTSSELVHSPPYHLKELRLSSGHISGSQLLQFLPCTPSSTLKRLYLISVSGLTNNDLRSILTVVAPMLSVLHIQNTHAPRTSTDEAYALDATIDLMPSIKCVTLDGDHMSALTIARKQRSGRPNPSGPEAENNLRGSITLIIHKELDVVHAQGVVRALWTSGWKHVVVWWNKKMAWNADTAWDEERFAEVAPRIQEAGMHLRFRFFDRSLRITPSTVKYKPGWSPMLPFFH